MKNWTIIVIWFRCSHRSIRDRYSEKKKDHSWTPEQRTSFHESGVSMCACMWIRMNVWLKMNWLNRRQCWFINKCVNKLLVVIDRSFWYNNISSIIYVLLRIFGQSFNKILRRIVNQWLSTRINWEFRVFVCA